MERRRRRLCKSAAVRFADAPWNECHPDWIRLGQELSPDHPARKIVAAMDVLDLRPLWASYGAGGTPPIRPDLMLRIVLIELQQGRATPAKWCRDAREHTPLMWAGLGIRPSRTCWYEFADRIVPFLDRWNREVLDAAQRHSLTPATRGAQDGSAVAANASRHRLLNEERLAARREVLAAARAADAAGRLPALTPGWMASTPQTREEQSRRLEQAALRLAERHAVNARQSANRRRPREKVVVSPTDPAAALGRDKLNVFRPLYNVQLVLDLDSSLILGYDVLAQSGDEGTLGPMQQRLRQTFGVHLKDLLVDTTYVTACNLALCQRQGATLYGPWRENDHSAEHRSPPKQLPKAKFQWEPDQKVYRCPQGHELTRIGAQRRPQSDGEVHVMHHYHCRAEHCRACPIRTACTPNPRRGRSVKRSEHEDLISAHKARMATPEAQALYKLRCQTVERGFADFKEHRNLERFSGRGLARARRQLAATVLANNLMVLAESLSQPVTPDDTG